jgi:hypothetical protein
VVGLVLRVHCLRDPYLWLDEFTTLWAIDGHSYWQMLDRALHWTAHGPLFLLSYRLSCDLAGPVWGLKLPGVICGTAGVLAAWWTARKLFQRADVALAAAWFVAIGPQFVNFSQEGRPYMPATLLGTLALGLLASWLRSGRRMELAGVVLLSLAAVGFHLLAVLGLVAQNVAVIWFGWLHRWERRRWMDWFVAQALAGCGLAFVGVQFWLLSGRQGGMIFETKLPMLTRYLLDRDLGYEVRAEVAVVLVALMIWLCSRKFPNTTVATAWREHAPQLLIAAAGYVVPTVLLSMLAVLRVVDSWPRYYFLFHPSLMLALAWLATCPFSSRLARVAPIPIAAAMLCQYSLTDVALVARVRNGWRDFSLVQDDLRRRVAPGDLVLSRAGLIEGNQPSFLSSATGTSYLRCFLEGKDGPLPCEHIPLPFSVESAATADYLELLAAGKLAGRDDFWLVNLGPSDVDYRKWIAERFGERFRKVDEVHYSLVVVCRYVRDLKGAADEAAGTGGDQNKRDLRFDHRDRLEGPVPAVNCGMQRLRLATTNCANAAVASIHSSPSQRMRRRRDLSASRAEP